MDLFLEDWLSHPEYWFSGNDSYIRQKYSHLLTTEKWEQDNFAITYHLSFIILYDQVPRHVYRNADPDGVIAIYLNKALYIYNFIYKNPNFNTEDFIPLEWCFFNLPVRHNNVSKDIIRVIQDTWKRIKSTKDTVQYSRFLKSTYSRININQQEYLEYSNSGYNVTNFIDYIDVLANCPFNLSTGNPEDSNIYQIMEDFVVKYKLKDIIISLSGGVDSMICSFILKKLQNKYEFNMIAVHIDYANRSYKEYEFVKDWCAFLKLPLFTRHITEINRKDCMEYGMRNIYEDYTKKVRFDTYKAVSAFPKVIMGHNYDDCFENILTNIANKDKYCNLKGFVEEQHIDDIHFLRPILNIKKKDIYLFAYKYDIPYLHDSTPEWCQRGKIRDSVRPILNKWNKEAIPGFFELANRLTDYENIISSVIGNMAIINDTNDIIKIPCSRIILSKIVWKYLLENLGIYASNRSLSNLIKSMEHTYYDLKYQKNKTLKVTLNKSNTLQYSIGDGFLSIKIIYL